MNQCSLCRCPLVILPSTSIYNDAQPWQLVLAVVEAAANEEDSILELSSISKVVGPTKMEGGPLKRLVDRVLGEL